ncbi:MAG: hypothetical protein K2Q07_00595 [Burkholderiaceae bacterium]|nr:hypothetical protein [Burkholderiaceae bacterium]
MRSFPFLRPTPSDAGNRSGASADAAFQDTLAEPRRSDLRGWFDSSSDLKGGLQVQEDDFDSLPADVRASFPPR